MKKIRNLFVGTKNKAKLEAVAEVIKEYPFPNDIAVVAKSVHSGVDEQPKSLDETIVGAKNRAKAIFEVGNLSMGLESGLMRVPHTKTDFMNVCVCAIYDGKEYHLGLSSSFEYPKKVMKLVIEKGMDVSEAFFQSGLTDDINIGSAGGAIGILTKGRLVRKDLTKQSIEMAMIHLENDHLY